jgi:hypothetical protein
MEMTDEELKAIEDRAKAAMPGPWRWNLNLKAKQIRLESTGYGTDLEIVMDFVRWGMGGARPRFQNPERLMVHAEAWSKTVPRREHHADWFRSLSHPDAEFIAHARKDVELLLEEIRELKGRIKVLEECDSRS